MPSTSERYVVLRGGLSVPLEPVLLLLDLESRGFDVSREDDAILIRPKGRLTDADRNALKRWRPHVLALLSYEPEAIQ